MAAESVAAAAPPVLGETEALPWRRRTTGRSLRLHGRLWTLWTAGVIATFTAPGAVLLYIEPLTFPIVLISFAHAVVICHLQARRGARSLVPIGSPASNADRAALGLLGDLLGHSERELVAKTGLALQRGELGVWLVGEQGAIMVRPGGRRADCWCVRVAEQGELPGGDLVAHLLLALREDEGGFATVANLGFSGSARRVRRRLPQSARPALDAARALARDP